MRSWVKVLLCAMTLISLASARASVLVSSKDAAIFESSQNNSGGGSPGIFAGRDNTSKALRGLIAFDFASAGIASGAMITTAQLTLTLGQVAGGGGGGGGGGGSGADTTPRVIGLHALSADWGEGTQGSSSTTFTGIGAGFPAAHGDATWTARQYDATSPTLWNSAGGDFAASASATQTVSQSINTGYTWSSAAMIADVQGWVNTPATNFGWLLKNESETGSQNFRGFWSKEASNTSYRPQLLVTYTVPEPSIGVAGVAMLTFGLRKRRQILPSPSSTNNLPA